MTDATRALVAYRMERARDALSEAALLFEAGHLNAYINRLYYACFYAMSALLVTRGISTNKHAHLRSLLHRDFVNRRINTRIATRLFGASRSDPTAW